MLTALLDKVIAHFPRSGPPLLWLRRHRKARRALFDCYAWESGEVEFTRRMNDSGSAILHGGFGLFYYPPTFAPLILPLGLLAATTATWAWIAGSLAAFLVGVAVLPVARDVRWWIVLLAGWSFPFVYALKLGQVGPILFATFAIGWRWLDRPTILGISGAIGAAIKLQPGLILI